MEDYQFIQLLERMDERSAQISQLIANNTAQLAQVINNQTTALHSITRYADVFAQSLTAIQQRQLFAMEERTIALQAAAKSLEIAARILQSFEAKQ